MKFGIIGAALSGKTSLFCLLTGIADTSKLTGSALHYNVGNMYVHDERLDWLHQLANVPRKIYISFDIIDFAALQTGTIKETEYIAQLRLMDAFLHLIRTFDVDENLIPNKIQEAINAAEAQFILSDLETIQNRIERIKAKLKKAKEKTLEEELELLEKCNNWLNQEKPLRDYEFKTAEEKLLKGFGFLSQKPILHIININENFLSKEDFLEKIIPNFSSKKVSAIVSSIKLEKELNELPNEEARFYAKEFGLKEWGKLKISNKILSLLNLISFFTIGKEEVRAWAIPAGTIAQKAAGLIHSDIERGFIKAEVIPFETLKRYNNLTVAKKEGHIRYEGKEYIIQDGDIIQFKFNV